MSFRGGRGGRGGFRSGFHHSRGKQEPFILFPENIVLPDRKCVSVNEDFVRWNYKFETYFENSPYVVEESAIIDSQPQDIERYSDSLKPRNNAKREAVSDFMKLQPGYFPSELLHGVKARPQKKVKWNVNLDQYFDKHKKQAKSLFDEKIEGGKENDEDDGEDAADEEEDDYSSGGEYDQNEDFDDDEDDFNDKDDGDDEPFF